MNLIASWATKPPRKEHKEGCCALENLIKSFISVSSKLGISEKKLLLIFFEKFNI